MTVFMNLTSEYVCTCVVCLCACVHVCIMNKLSRMFYVLGIARKALKSSHILGIGNGFTDGFIYFMYAIVFRFGTFLIIQDEDHFLHREFDDIYTLVTKK